MPRDSGPNLKDASSFETGRPFAPSMFESVLMKFSPDVPNGISGRPRFVFSYLFTKFHFHLKAPFGIHIVLQNFKFMYLIRFLFEDLVKLLHLVCKL